MPPNMTRNIASFYVAEQRQEQKTTQVSHSKRNTRQEHQNDKIPTAAPPGLPATSKTLAPSNEKVARCASRKTGEKDRREHPTSIPLAMSTGVRSGCR